MDKTLLVLLACASAFAAGCDRNGTPSDPPFTPPELVLRVVPDQLELGDVTEGDSVGGRITLSNVSGHAITDLAVETSCGCARPVLGSKAIAPSESTTLDVTVATANRPSQLAQTVVLTGTHRGTPLRWSIPVVARVVPIGGIHIRPNRIDGSGRPGDPVDLKLEVSAERSSVSVALDRVSPPEWLRAAVSGDRPRAWTVNLTGRLPQTAGVLSDRVRLSMTIDGVPRDLFVPLSYTIQSSISVAPRAIVKRLENPAARLTSEIRLTVARPESLANVRVARVECHGGEVTAAVRTEPGARECTVELSGAFGPPAPGPPSERRTCRGAVEIEATVLPAATPTTIRVPFVFVSD
jgi:hypothetical protein